MYGFTLLSISFHLIHLYTYLYKTSYSVSIDRILGKINLKQTLLTIKKNLDRSRRYRGERKQRNVLHQYAFTIRN